MVIREKLRIAPFERASHRAARIRRASSALVETAEIIKIKNLDIAIYLLTSDKIIRNA